jgi:hypothetical protein
VASPYAIEASQAHCSTQLGKAVADVAGTYDRLIVITDEQAHDSVPAPTSAAYMVNVASYKNGVGYGRWVHIDGWSEAVIDYIRVRIDRLDQLRLQPVNLPAWGFAKFARTPRRRALCSPNPLHF